MKLEAVNTFSQKKQQPKQPGSGQVTICSGILIEDTKTFTKTWWLSQCLTYYEIKAWAEYAYAVQVVFESVWVISIGPGRDVVPLLDKHLFNILTGPKISILLFYKQLVIVFWLHDNNENLNVKENYS